MKMPINTSGVALAAVAAILGQNSCKGQGFLELTQKECTAAKAMAQ